MNRVCPQYSLPVRRLQAMNHRLSQSAGRSRLNPKNSHQLLGAASTNGRFTATQAPAPAQAKWMPRSGSRSRNRPRTNGTSSRAG